MRTILQLTFKISIYLGLPLFLILGGLWLYRNHHRTLVSQEFLVAKPGFMGVETIVTAGGEQKLVVLRAGYHQPAIIFFHGGPARPESAFAPQILKDLNSTFSLYFWDQAGSGLSYPGTDFSVLSWDRLKADALEVVEDIASKHQQVFISAHGYGCLLALHTAKLTTNTVSGLLLNSPLLQPLQDLLSARTHMMEMARVLQNSRAYAQLDEISLPLSANEAIRIEQWVSRLGGEIYQKGTFREALRMSWYSPFYDLSDLWSLDRGIIQSIPRLFSGLMQENLSTLDSLEVPVLLLIGEKDFRIPEKRVSSWFSNLNAPQKQEIRFPEAAHYPQVESTKKWMEEVRKFVSQTLPESDESAAKDRASAHAEIPLNQNP